MHPDNVPTALPFPRSYWARPGKLLAGCYPGDKTPAGALEKLQGLVRCGVTRVLNLMRSTDVDHNGEAFAVYDEVLQDLARAEGQTIVCERYPVRDLDVPSVEEMVAILDRIDFALERGETVYVHCWGGRGRTGTVVGCHLVRHGIAPEGKVLPMLAQLTKHERSFGTIPEMPVQRDFVNAWRTGQ